MSMFRIVGIFVAAFAAGIVGLVLVLPLGLVVHEDVIFPLALAVAALLAALGAGWVGSRPTHDRTRTRLLSVVGITEATAAGIVLLFMLIPELHARLLGPLINVAMISALTLSLSATVAAVRCRTTLPTAARDRSVTLALLALALVAVPGVIMLASLFGLTGA